MEKSTEQIVSEAETCFKEAERIINVRRTHGARGVFPGEVIDLTCVLAAMVKDLARAVHELQREVERGKANT